MFWLYEGSVGCLHWYVPQCHHCPNVWGLKSTRAENGSMMLKLLNDVKCSFLTVQTQVFFGCNPTSNPPCFDLRCQFWLRLWRLGNLTVVKRCKAVNHSRYPLGCRCFSPRNQLRAAQSDVRELRMRPLTGDFNWLGRPTWENDIGNQWLMMVNVG